jgi:OTU domain-containing protein 3
MVENQDHFKFFIEDDVTFDDYIKDMTKDGTWGGNLEIYALSMKFSVNFYIYIYNHPMYIVKNFNKPARNVHLTYHDGQHYNSVRLKDDFSDEIPQYIPLDLINCVEQSTSMQAPDQLEDEEEKDSDEEDDKKEETESKIIHSSNTLQNENIQNGEIILNGTIIKDLKDKDKSEKLKRCIITQEGIILDEIKDFSKCHCERNKKYKNCCVTDDTKGEFDKQNNIFYCDLEVFKSKNHYEIKDKEELKTSKNNSNGELSGVTKQMDRIFI